MLQKTLGIVLHTLKYKDTSLIADIYTEVAGRASFMVSIPRSRKAAVKPVLFQPLLQHKFHSDIRLPVLGKSSPWTPPILMNDHQWQLNQERLVWFFLVSFSSNNS